MIYVQMILLMRNHLNYQMKNEFLSKMTDTIKDSQFKSSNPLITKREVVAQLHKYRNEICKSVHEIPGVVTEISCVTVINLSLSLMREIDHIVKTLSKAIEKEECKNPIPENVTFNSEGIAVFKHPAFHIGERVNRKFMNMSEIMQAVNDPEQMRTLMGPQVSRRLDEYQGDVVRDMQQIKLFTSMLDANKEERVDRGQAKDDNICIADASPNCDDDDDNLSDSSYTTTTDNDG